MATSIAGAKGADTHQRRLAAALEDLRRRAP
jgi:hypothetical protein